MSDVKPCVKCGARDRNKGGHCRPCTSARTKAWYEANKDYMKAWREANKDYIKAWREANPERIKDYNKAWYEANTERAKANNKAWREANPEMHRRRVRKYKNKKRNAIFQAELRATIMAVSKLKGASSNG